MDCVQQSDRQRHRPVPDSREHQCPGPSLRHQPQRDYFRGKQPGQHTHLRRLKHRDQRQPGSRRPAQQQGCPVYLFIHRGAGRRWHAAICSCTTSRRPLWRCRGSVWRSHQGFDRTGWRWGTHYACRTQCAKCGHPRYPCWAGHHCGWRASRHTRPSLKRSGFEGA